MRKSWKVITRGLAACLLLAMWASAADVTLYESDGTAFAYIADDQTIYLWSGDPVGRLESAYGNEFHVFGVSGQHLGWYAAGVFHDDKGLQVGASAGALSLLMGGEPAKLTKKPWIRQGYKDVAPVKPVFSNKASSLRFRDLLKPGDSC